VHYSKGWLCLDNGTSLQIEKEMDGERSVNFDIKTELKLSELIKSRSRDLCRQVDVGLARLKAVQESSGLDMTSRCCVREGCTSRLGCSAMSMVLGTMLFSGLIALARCNKWRCGVDRWMSTLITIEKNGLGCGIKQGKIVE
jgi:hypothetical protein